MADSQKDKENRTRRTAGAYDSTRTGDDPSFVAVNTLPTKETTTERVTPGVTGEDRARSRAETGHSPAMDRPLTEKTGEKLHETKEDVKETVGAKPETDDERRGTMVTDRTGMGLPPRTTTTTRTTRDVDWDRIQHPGMEPCDEPYGTRPVSELTPPPVVQDKADLAAIRMMDRDKQERDRLERERMAAMGTTTAATTRTTTTRIEPAAGERTSRAGAPIGTEPATRITPERPVTGVVVPPGTTTVTPMKPYGTVDERSRMHAEDPSVHPDWETQPQINAPRDVGVPTAEGQSDAARLRAGERTSDMAKEPHIDRRGGEYEVPAASGARRDMTDDRGLTQKVKDKARDVKEDVDRKI